MNIKNKKDLRVSKHYTTLVPRWTVNLSPPPNKSQYSTIVSPPSPQSFSESSESSSQPELEEKYENSPKRYRVGGIVLDSKDNLLIVFGRQSQKWSLPKGALNDGEEHLKGALREIWEETGFKMKPKQKSDDIMSWTINKARIYLLRLNETTPPPNPLDRNEVEKAVWLNLNDQSQVLEIKEKANKMLIVALERLERIHESRKEK